MSEIDRDKEKELNPEWREGIAQAIEEQIDNFEAFSQVELIDEAPGTFRLMPVQFDPITIYPEDDRTLWHLTPSEREFIFKTVFDLVGFNMDNPEFVTNFESKTFSLLQSDPDPLIFQSVTIYKTNRSDTEGIYLHETVDSRKNYKEYLLATKDYRHWI